MCRYRALLTMAVLLAGCGGDRRSPESFSPLAEQFVYSTLSISPVLATSVGYHEHQGVRLDEQLNDLSGAGLDKQRQFFRDVRNRIARDVKPDLLSAEDRADYSIVQDQISAQLLELDVIQNWRHNPTVYVELIGNAIFTPYLLEYAPQPERVRHITARLEKIPGFLDEARRNLADAPEIWTRVAVEENDGNIGLIDKTVRAGVPREQRAAYDRAADGALKALRGFNDWLKSGLKPSGDWRLGKDKYAQKFRYALETDVPPGQVLAAAEAELKAVRAQMLDLARPLHRKMYPAHKEHLEMNVTIAETLARIAEKHATPDTYIADAKGDLEEARRFVKEKGLLPLPPRDNLQVIETPEFMRGIYAVGGFVPAPALEPGLGAFYWITPIPKNWPKPRIESKLREYNHYGLKLLTIHEAMPGHYVQLEYANEVEPKPRRLLRGVFGNGPYVEGWAVYATEVMLDQGYLTGSPELRLTFQKQQLRMLANAILDVRLHTLDMTDQQALDLMIKDTFQETEEATAKLRRAKLSSAQLPTYYVGWRDWRRLRDHYQKVKEDQFRLAEFHERALKAGAVPIPALAQLITGRALAE